MLAPAEDARDAAELEWRAKKRGAHRLAVLIEEVAGDGLAGEAHGVDRAAGQLECRRDHAADAHAARRRDGSLGDDLELVANLQIAAHVDAILVYVGERPGELLARAGGQIVLRARVHRGVEVRRDRPTDDDRVGGPRDAFFHASPCVAATAKVKQPID